MRLPEFGVRYPTTNLMIFAAVLVIGLFSLSRMALDLMPELEPPVVSVITKYEGASAEDIETKVTKVIENQVSIVSDLEKIRSNSFENFSVVTAQFEWGTDLDEAANEIRERLEFAKRFLPDEIETPIVFKFNMAIFPIAVFGVSAEETYSRLYDLVDKEVVDYLKRIPEVGAVQLMGGLERQINIYINKDKLQAYHLSLAEICRILAQENITQPAGEIKAGLTEYTLRVPGEFEDPGELNNVIVGQFKGELVYLQDIARIEDGFKEITNVVHSNYKPALMMMVQKRSGANTVFAVSKVKKELEWLKKRLPPDVNFSLLMDSAEFIQWSIDDLSRTLYIGGIFVILVVWLFLRRMTPSFIIAMSIPFSLIITFIFMYFMGYTINIITLSSLAIAIGMVVDNAIVIVDNVFRHRQTGEKIREASIFGTSEMMLAISASTLTTVVVFFPMMFVTGITGVLFKPMAIIVIICLVASLFTALTFIPMLCSRLLGKISFLENDSADNSVGKRKGWLKNFYSASERSFAKVEDSYAKFLGYSLKHKKQIVLVTILIFISTLLLIPLIGTEFIPEEDTGEVRVNVELAVGSRVEEAAKVAEQIEEIIKNDVPEARTVFSNTGQSSSGMGATFGRKQGSHVVMAGMKLVRKNQRNRSSRQIASQLREKINRIPGIMKLSFESGSALETIVLGGRGKPLSVEVLGHSIEETNKIAGQIKAMLETIPGAVDITVSRDVGKPELKVKVDREKAATLGLNMSLVSDAIRTAFYGKVATRYREKGDEYDIFVRFREDDRKTLDDILSTTIKSPTGKAIRLSNIATIYQGTGPLDIERRDQERIVSVDANVFGRSVGKVTQDLQAKMEKLQVPSGIIVKLAGDIEEQRKAFKSLLAMLILGILLVYMVMAAQFESLLDPFVIMFSVPFAFVGVAWALFLTRATLSVVSFIGLIMLMGIVVNNAIVLVSYINILRARGYPMVEAVKESGRSRLRPVLMTTLTTLFGMLPLALLQGEGSEIWQPLGITVIGGLLVSMLVTLVLVPTLYAIFEERVKKNNHITVRGV